MAIERVIDVMTIGNTPGLDGTTILLGTNQMYKGTFVWGVKYSSNESRPVEVELVYEVRDTKGIYLVRPPHSQTELIGHGVVLYGRDEYRLEFFKSNENYKKFFETLNNWLRESRIVERDYTILLEKFRALFARVPSLSLAQGISMLHGFPNPRIQALKEAKTILSGFPLVQSICQETNISLL